MSEFIDSVSEISNIEGVSEGKLPKLSRCLPNLTDFLVVILLFISNLDSCNEGRRGTSLININLKSFKQLFYHLFLFIFHSVKYNLFTLFE